jgi:flagellar motility protein MotE (MotC chaperone)
MLPLISLTFAHMLVKYSEQSKSETTPVVEEITDEVIDELSKEAGKKEKEVVEKYQPYIPTQEDLNKLQQFFEKRYEQKIDVEQKIDTVNDTVSDTVSEVITPTPTPTEPLYFVDDEPVIEPQINRLVYTKNG